MLGEDQLSDHSSPDHARSPDFWGSALSVFIRGKVLPVLAVDGGRCLGGFALLALSVLLFLSHLQDEI
jgi:hypothetical protein